MEAGMLMRPIQAVASGCGKCCMPALNTPLHARNSSCSGRLLCARHGQPRPPYAAGDWATMSLWTLLQVSPCNTAYGIMDRHGPES
jgi:hypothetical protein